MTWTNIENYELWQWFYLIGRIITTKTMLAISTLLFLSIIKYQTDKPPEEKNAFDNLFRDNVIVAFLVNIWFCMVYIIGIYTPIPLKEENCLWVGYISYGMFLLPLSSMLVTIYIKMVMVFQPEDMEGSNIQIMSIKAFVWKMVALAFATMLDWKFHFPQSVPILGVLTKKKNTQM